MSGSDESWERAERIAWGPAPYLTVFRALWNEAGLYLCFDASDDSPWFTMTGRDDHLWEEEVVEIFLDPARAGRNYAELEINPANVVCDVLMREPWPKQHSDLAWDIAGLETRVTELVHPGSTAGWCAHAFIPWAALATLPDADRVSLPPAPGDTWDFNVFRIKRPGGPAAPAAGAIFAAWSPPRGASFHDVERFGEMGFSNR
jgi:hypothetical protein